MICTMMTETGMTKNAAGWLWPEQGIIKTIVAGIKGNLSSTWSPVA